MVFLKALVTDAKRRGSWTPRGQSEGLGERLGGSLGGALGCGEEA